MAQIIPVYSMIRKDLSQLLHNKSFMITAVVTILFNLILPNILTFQVRNVKVATVTYDNSELSNRIIQDIGFANDFSLVGHCATYDEALSLIKEGTADCIVEIPNNFERNLTNKLIGVSAIEPQIQVTANAINTTKVLSATQGIIGSIVTSLHNYSKAHGVVISGSDTFITAKNLYNPSSDYKLLMLPVLFIAITFVFNLATRLITNELQYGTIDQIYVSPMSRLAFMTSKTVSCYILSMVNILISMAAMWIVYDFMPHGSFVLIFIALTLYVISCSSIALTLCNLSSSTTQMVLFSSVFSLIAMMMSGYMTPLECVAEWLQPFSYILPTRYLIIILRNVTLKGSTFLDLYPEFIPLVLMTVIFFILSVISCKKSRS